MAKVSQKIIADQLCLSRTTVSRCFTHHPKINPETRARVFHLAAELGYQYSAPRNQKPALQERQERIAVLIGVPANRKDHRTTAEPILKGISEQVAALGMSLEVHFVDPASFHPKMRSRKILPGTASSDWNGLIMMFAFDGEAVYNLSRKYPLISLLEDYEHQELDCIDTDHVRGISKLMDHLHALGHQKIGFLSWKYPSPLHWVERRFGAYAENLFRLNLDFDPGLVINVRRDAHLHEDQIPGKVIRAMRQGVHAWICAADHQAIHLVRNLQQRGIQVPRDVSIAGYDGLPCPPDIPALTTIQMPFPEIGHSAVVSLRRRMIRPATVRRLVLVNGKFVEGASTAPPPVPAATS